MSKNYILEPVELTFTIYDLPVLGDVAAAQITTQFEINPDRLNELRLSIDDDVFICYGVDDVNDFLVFTPDGSSEGTPAINLSTSYVVIGPMELEGTHTVSIYTGEDDPEPEPAPTPSDNTLSKNYIFVDHPYNDVEAIDDKLGKCKKNDGGSDVTPEPAPAADSNVFIVHVGGTLIDGSLRVSTIETAQEILDAFLADKALLACMAMYESPDSFSYINVELTEFNNDGQGAYLRLVILGENKTIYAESLSSVLAERQFNSV